MFQPAFQAAATLDLVAAHQVTALIAVPAMVVSLLEAAAAAQKVSLAQSGQPAHATREACTPGQRGLRGRRSQNRRARGGGGRGGLPSVRRLLLGGGELPARLIWRLRLLCPCASISTAYGMTEACSSMTFLRLEAPDANFGAQPQSPRRLAGVCVGRPPPGIEMAILALPPAPGDVPEWPLRDVPRPAGCIGRQQRRWKVGRRGSGAWRGRRW